MKHNRSKFNGTTLGLTVSALLATTFAAQAAPAVTRLNPPSNLFALGEATPPIISRFMADQRFDLQATVQADAGQVITSAVFKVNGNVVPGTVTVTPIPGGAADRFNITLRAASFTTAGVHTLTVEATQGGSQVALGTGNFEIVRAVNGGRKAKNVIYFIGDGMGIAHRTAARLVKQGSYQGKSMGRLAIDTMPNTALLMTASLDSIITDSAPGAACYSTGNKSNNGQEGVFPDDTTDKWDNPRVEHMGNFLARTQGKALGIITTADVEDATPASFAIHTQDRGAGTGICDMFLDEAVANHNLRVLMGGGRKWFIPQGQPGSGRVGSATSSGGDCILPADLATAWNAPLGTVDPGRDLIAGFTSAGFTYAPDATTLNGIPANTDRLLGLFNTGNMDVALDKIAERRGGAAAGTVATFPDQPMLDEMTAKALQVLSRNPQGFVLMVEAASIDKQAHNMDTERFILDTLELDRSVELGLSFLESNPDTLMMVTADHECAGINIIGASRVTNSALTTASTSGGGATALRDPVMGNYEAAKFPDYNNMLADGYPATMDIDYKMLIGYAANATRFEDWLTNPVPNALPASRDTAGNFSITGQVPGTSAVHTGSDIPMSAAGRGAATIGGVMDNTEPFFKAMQAVIGGAK
jgi:alkaline phosphatase